MEAAAESTGDRPRKKLLRTDAPKRQKSRVSNGKHLFVLGDGRSPYTRRFKDILAAIVSDLGGFDNCTEGQKQLARRCASLSVACEKLEAAICGEEASAADVLFKSGSGGLSPYDVLNQASLILHGVARVKGGGRDSTIHQIADLPDDKLDRVVELLRLSGDLASRAIAAGSEHSALLELYGVLADRCGRCFQRLGLERVPRDVTDLRSRWAADAEALDGEIITAAADIAATVRSGPHTRAFDAEVVSDAPPQEERASEPRQSGARPSK
jgi:hypothetical protein